jgi:pSer/pThr/pTyr-binding forkhead associated (FHA) protein
MSQLFLYIFSTEQEISLEIRENVLFGREGGLSTDETLKVDLMPYRAYALGVSRRHAMLSRRNEEILVFDLASSNGTYLNGNLLVPHQGYVVEEEDKIKLGQFEFQVFLKPRNVESGTPAVKSIPDFSPEFVGPTGDIKTLPVEGFREYVRMLDEEQKNKKDSL